MLRKRAAYFWLTGASRTECERSRGVIRLGWVDIEPSFHLCGPFGCSSPHGTGDVSQFDSFPAAVSNNFSSLCYSCWEYQTAPDRFVTSTFVKQIASRMRSRRFRGAIKQTATASSASSAGTWEQVCGENDYALPPTATASRRRLTKRLRCWFPSRICQAIAF